MRKPPVEEIMVEFHHPWANPTIITTLETWMKVGPGLRPGIAPHKAFSATTGEPLPLSVIPLRYRNTILSRFLIRWGFLEEPWPDLRDKIQALTAQQDLLTPSPPQTAQRSPDVTQNDDLWL